MRLDDTTALVTGGGTGIGRAVACALAHEGCRVLVAGRREDKLRETAAQGEGRIQWHTLDVTDRTNVEQLVAWADDHLGRIDVLVNNAGINVPRRSMREIDPADWDFTMAVNATGAYNCMRAVLPQMRERRDGLIVNVASISGKRAGLLGGVAYNASKFALGALATTVALEEGKNGIRISTIYPGEVDTPILEDRPVPVTPEHRATILLPEDVAAVVLLLVRLPARAHVPELIIKPTAADYV